MSKILLCHSYSKSESYLIYQTKLLYSSQATVSLKYLTVYATAITYSTYSTTMIFPISDYCNSNYCLKCFVKSYCLDLTIDFSADSLNTYMNLKWDKTLISIPLK